MRGLGILLFLLGLAIPAGAHPAPFSYLDLQLREVTVEVTLVAHAIDLAHDLSLESPASLMDGDFTASQRERIFGLLVPRLSLLSNGAPLDPRPGDLEVLPDRQGVRLSLRFRLSDDNPGVLGIHAFLFPYDPIHQTFVNVYEGDDLTHQGILDKDRTSLEYYPGTRQGTLAVMQKFVPAGIHHIVIGPDHILFIVGLLLLGGSLPTLFKIVTAFTVAHSITLSLAALDILSPSSQIVEPAIALSIVYVGADNLLMSREARDVRGRIAFAFGLVHGFGFASVLRELDLPRQALGWSLFSFNLGVEIGQLAIVTAVAFALAVVRRQNALLWRRIVLGGSTVVMVAGVYWFVERVFLGGGVI